MLSVFEWWPSKCKKCIPEKHHEYFGATTGEYDLKGCSEIWCGPKEKYEEEEDNVEMASKV